MDAASAVLDRREEMYRRRVGLDGPIQPNERDLARLHKAHLESICFENFDVLLGRGVSLDPNDVFDHLVTRKRGGYCCNTSLLLHEALSHFGFDARLLLGRVLMGPPGPVPPQSHAFVCVRFDDEAFLVDVGFGAHTPRGVIPLSDGAELDAVGRRWRLDRDETFGWRLRDWTRDGWRDLYVFDESPTYFMDMEVGNYWISTCKMSPFVGSLLAVRHTPSGRITLLNRTASWYEGERRTSCELTSADELRRFTVGELQIDPGGDDAQWQALWQRVSHSSLPLEW